MWEYRYKGWVLPRWLRLQDQLNWAEVAHDNLPLQARLEEVVHQPWLSDVLRRPDQQVRFPKKRWRKQRKCSYLEKQMAKEEHASKRLNSSNNSASSDAVCDERRPLRSLPTVGREVRQRTVKNPRRAENLERRLSKENPDSSKNSKRSFCRNRRRKPFPELWALKRSQKASIQVIHSVSRRGGGDLREVRAPRVSIGWWPECETR